MPAGKAKAILDCVVAVATDKSVQKLVFGQYTDGTPRSIVDAMNGEYDSPKTRRRNSKKHKKAKKHKKTDVLDHIF